MPAVLHENNFMGKELAKTVWDRGRNTDLDDPCSYNGMALVAMVIVAFSHYTTRL